jgi:hypothetical protein
MVVPQARDSGRGIGYSREEKKNQTVPSIWEKKIMSVF